MNASPSASAEPRDDTGSTVRLWHAASSSAEPGPLERRCECWLGADERARADRFRVATSRNQHVVGRGMARRLLAGDGVPPQRVRFGLQTHGKPYVTAPESARRPFNVAHTDGLVLCGVATTQHALLGVDVERLGRRTDPDLARRYFSPPEVALLDRCVDPELRSHLFLRIWTLKEAFIKAIGTGLQTPLRDFAFENVAADRPRITLLSPTLQDERVWHFFSLQPRPGYVGAVAVAIDPPQPSGVQLVMHPFEETSI
jgi:4'-phosphopantetheinyl transferase